MKRLFLSCAWLALLAPCAWTQANLKSPSGAAASRGAAGIGRLSLPVADPSFPGDKPGTSLRPPELARLTFPKPGLTPRAAEVRTEPTAAQGPQAAKPGVIAQNARRSLVGFNESVRAAQSLRSPSGVPEDFAAPIAPMAENPLGGRRDGARPALDHASLSDKIWKHAAARGFALGPPALATGEQDSAARVPLPAAASSQSRQAADAVAASVSAAETEPSSAARVLKPYLGGLGAMQLGLEAMALVIPQLTKTLGESFLVMAGVASVGFGALMLGSLLGGPLVDRLGLRASYRGLLVLRTAAAAVFSLCFLTGSMSLPALAVLFGLDYLFLGGCRIAEAVLPRTLYPRSPLGVKRFGTAQQALIESMGFLGPLAAGLVIAWQGFAAIAIAYPLLLGAGAVMLWTFLPLPGKSQAAGKAQPRGLGMDWRSIQEAWTTLRAHPFIGRAALGFALVSILTYCLYFMIAPAFGLFAAGSAPAAATVNSQVTGLFAGGGMAGTWLMLWLDARMKRRLETVPENQRPQAAERSLLRATARWTMAASIGGLGGCALALGAGGAALPMILLGTAIMGLTTCSALVHLENVVKNNAPAEVQGTLMGLVRAAMNLASIIGFFGLGAIFKAFSILSGTALVPTGMAFAVVAGGFVLFSLAMAWIAHGLRRAQSRLL
ncbi:MAG TPA: hypothetical protein DEB40_12655 [Elusimicrobia bacterium]|nr:hypothetical protein [Elusimicrobiota bacterium]HBT62584.1 hypothetical protein [Elusimicrobiota bacterium]